jgi:hypothetical protein
MTFFFTAEDATEDQNQSDGATTKTKSHHEGPESRRKTKNQQTRYCRRTLMERKKENLPWICADERGLGVGPGSLCDLRVLGGDYSFE